MFEVVAKAVARAIKHEEENPGHRVYYSIKDSANHCNSCDYLHYAIYTEEDIDRLVAAEYECHTRDSYPEEIEQISEANFHHEHPNH